MSDNPTVRDYCRGWAETHINDPEQVESVVEQILSYTLLPPSKECTPKIREALNALLVGDGPTVRKIYFQEIAREVDETFARIVVDAFVEGDCPMEVYALDEPSDTVPKALEPSLRNDLREHYAKGGLQPLPRTYRVHGPDELREQLPDH